MLFNKYYRGQHSILKYYWMPKYIDCYDSSARTLDLYNQKKNKNPNKKEEINNVYIY